MNIFIDDNDLEEQYGEQLYKEYLEKENKQMKQDITTMNNEIERLNNIINEIKECLSKNRVYITGERNLAFELDDILKGVDKE